jgi:type II secretory pathway pseudopilin PulG
METEKKKKLSVCDWCVLVVIFGMGASLLTPGVTQAVEEKKLSDLVDRLHAVRAEIQLYQADHNGLLPGQRYPKDIVTEERFLEALRKERVDSKGSYLRWMPANPYVTDPERCDRVMCVNDPDLKPTGAEGVAWWFNGATGEFYAADSAFHTNY